MAAAIGQTTRRSDNKGNKITRILDWSNSCDKEHKLLKIAFHWARRVRKSCVVHLVRHQPPAIEVTEDGLSLVGLPKGRNHLPRSSIKRSISIQGFQNFELALNF